MNIEEIRNLNVEGVEHRMNQIREEMNGENADIDALSSEVDALEERRNTIRNLRSQAEERSRLASRIAAGQIGTQLRSLNELNHAAAPEQRFTAGSPEYRSAWLKNLAVRGDGQRIFGELTDVEKRAFTFTTANTGAVVPTETMNKIIELVDSESPILDDAAMSSMTRGFGVPRHKSIDAGDATGVAEGAANDDEQDTFDLLTLSGVGIKKHVVLTYEMQFLSIDAFESWLTSHLAARIRVAKEKLILSRLDGTAPAGGSANAAAGIAAGNVLTGQSYSDATIRAIFGRIKANGPKVVYANNATIWGQLAGMEGTNGEKLFVPNSMVDPIVAGRIYGAEVKVDNNLSDNVIYVGVKGAVLANSFDALTIHAATEPKTLNTVITAAALFDAGLQHPEGFVKATFTAG